MATSFDAQHAGHVIDVPANDATSLDSTEPFAAAAHVKAERYRNLGQELDQLLMGETDFTANLANTAALIYHGLPGLNWAGFYLLRNDTLVLGPFQGKPACVRIAIGKGVCGAAAEQRCSIVVADVHAFAGHIACDTASRAELVVPLVIDGGLLGVLDLDSPHAAHFDMHDQTGCESLMAVLLCHIALATAT